MVSNKAAISIIIATTITIILIFAVLHHKTKNINKKLDSIEYRADSIIIVNKILRGNIEKLNKDIDLLKKERDSVSKSIDMLLKRNKLNKDEVANEVKKLGVYRK